MFPVCFIQFILNISKYCIIFVYLHVAEVNQTFVCLHIMYPFSDVYTMDFLIGWKQTLLLE